MRVAVDERRAAETKPTNSALKIQAPIQHSTRLAVERRQQPQHAGVGLARPPRGVVVRRYSPRGGLARLETITGGVD